MTKDSSKETAGKASSTIKTPPKQQKDAPMLKVVIRCLPPTLNEEEFLKIVEPLPGHDFFKFVNADSSLGQYACSRAYLNFLSQNEVVNFRDKWDGFPFKDTNGKEYPAVVEHAPYQKIPKKSNRKPDPRCGTIEEDEDYKKFLEALTAEIEPLPSAEAYLEELEAKQRAASSRVTTPLIDFLKKKRIERIKARDKLREERRQKEKERKRQREEEKRRQEKERKKKKEERERREKDVKQKKEEAAKSDGERKAREREKVKEDEKKKSKELEKKDAQIKLLKKSDKDSDDKDKGKEPEQTRGKYDGDRRKSENAKQQEISSRDRDRNAYPKSSNDKRKPSSARDSKDKDSDRFRDRGGGRDRYGDRERDRRQPSKASSQESLQRTAGKSRSGDKLDGRDRDRDGDDRRGDRREAGKPEVREDREGKDVGRKMSLDLKKEDEKERDARKEERTKIRNKDRPDMARYQPGQRSWSSRTAKKDEGSNSPRTSPTSSEGEKPKIEAKKADTPTQKSPMVAGDSKKVEEKRPTAAKKFESQVRSSGGRSSSSKEDVRGKMEQRSGDRNRERGVGRGYREERSNRNRQRLDDARRKAEEAKNVKGPDKEPPLPLEGGSKAE